MASKTKKYVRRHKRHKRKTTKPKIGVKLNTGGKIIDSGGFGCIFKPSLVCKSDENARNARNNKYISKLMPIKSALSEYNNVNTFGKILKRIPNSNKYFLFNDTKMCEPLNIPDDELTDFNEKCQVLSKKNINSKNVNKMLSGLSIMNMPYGGINIYEYLASTSDNSDNYINVINSLNALLIDLLQNAIIPMNRLKVYHADIKDTNILIDVSNGASLKIIDWGLSFVYDYKGIPKNMYRRPFQYNVPYSNILFNKDFVKMYYVFLDTIKGNDPSSIEIREFVYKYIQEWNKIRGEGHMNVINGIFKKLDIDNHDNKCIIEYISNILLKYTVNLELNLIGYFESVFLKNLDIWGFVFAYLPIVEKYENNIRLKNVFSDIVQNVLFKYANEQIDINVLLKELDKFYIEKNIVTISLG